MKILDRYVAKNFLIGYVISFGVLIGLRIIIDLFVNLDEFAEHADLGTLAVMKNIFSYYSLHAMLYYRDFAGMITVVAAAFSLGKMVRSNELVAVMASGVSLKRVIAPIIILAIIFAGVLVVDQEFIIPPLADKLVRSHDSKPGEESYDFWFIADKQGALLCSQRFDVASSTMYKPTIITRKPTGQTGLWEVTGRISAEKAVYNQQEGRWDLFGGFYTEKDSIEGTTAIEYYTSDVGPRNIPIRRKSRYKPLLSWAQLGTLARQETQIRDLPELYSQRHFRVTEPIINLVMLMVSLPLLVCRDPKSMKSGIMISFALTTACFILTFVCKMMAVEVFFERVIPEFLAWLPVFIFLPIAFIEIDSMKT